MTKRIIFIAVLFVSTNIFSEYKDNNLKKDWTIFAYIEGSEGLKHEALYNTSQMAKWEKIQELADKIPQKELWLIEEGRSKHANNHLKLKEEYQEKMHKWTDRILNKEFAA